MNHLFLECRTISCFSTLIPKVFRDQIFLLVCDFDSKVNEGFLD